jgi:uncharacterized phage protein (TIGR02218 family)
LTREIGPELQEHLNQEVTTLAELWLLTRTDSVIHAFTTHDTDITYLGETYLASDGFEPTAISSNRMMAVDNFDLKGFITQFGINELDLQAGIYDGAKIDFRIVNYKDLTMDHFNIALGFTLGGVTLNDNDFNMEARSKLDKLQQSVGELYGPECKAKFADATDLRCGILAWPAFYEVGLAVTEATSQRAFISTDMAAQTSDIYAYGIVFWQSGDKAGLKSEIKSFNYTTGQILLNEPLIYPIQIGDTFALLQGCDKRRTTCANRFNNEKNFRGEPFVSGFDQMYNTPLVPTT